MAAIEVRAQNQHVGHLREYPTGEIRPVCDTCSYQGPKFIASDRPVAQSGLEAHIATVGVDGDTTVYQIRWSPSGEIRLPGVWIHGGFWEWHWGHGGWRGAFDKIVNSYG